MLYRTLTLLLLLVATATAQELYVTNGQYSTIVTDESGNASSVGHNNAVALLVNGWWNIYDINTAVNTNIKVAKSGKQLLWYQDQPLKLIIESGSWFLVTNDLNKRWKLPDIAENDGGAGYWWKYTVTAASTVSKYIWLHRDNNSQRQWLCVINLETGETKSAPLRNLTGEQDLVRRETFHSFYFYEDKAWILHRRAGVGAYDKKWWALDATLKRATDGFFWNHPTIDADGWSDTGWAPLPEGNYISERATASSSPITYIRNFGIDYIPEHLHRNGGYLVASVDVRANNVWTADHIRVYDTVANNRAEIARWEAKRQETGIFQSWPRPVIFRDTINNRLIVFWHSDVRNSPGITDVYWKFISLTPPLPPDPLAEIKQKYKELGEAIYDYAPIRATTN
jgi:hypothetical protein